MSENPNDLSNVRTTISEYWEDVPEALERALNRDLTDTEKELIRGVFYLGASSVLSILDDLVSRGSSDEVVCGIMEQLSSEREDAGHSLMDPDDA